MFLLNARKDRDNYPGPQTKNINIYFPWTCVAGRQGLFCVSAYPELGRESSRYRRASGSNAASLGRASNPSRSATWADPQRFFGFLTLGGIVPTWSRALSTQDEARP